MISAVMSSPVSLIAFGVSAERVFYAVFSFMTSTIEIRLLAGKSGEFCTNGRVSARPETARMRFGATPEFTRILRAEFARSDDSSQFE